MFYRLSLTIVFFIVSAMYVSAGIVVLSNGDRISGDILKMEKGKVTIKSEALGKISVDNKYIKTLETDNDIEVHPRDRKTLVGKVEMDDSGNLKVLEQDGSLIESFQIQDVKFLGKLPDPVNWEIRLSTGLSGSEGNSDLFNVHFGSLFKRRSEKSRSTLDSQYIYERNNGNKSKDEWYSDFKYDYFFSKKIYGFSTVRAQQDDIAQLDLRLSLSPGIGYQWIESDELSFSTEIGPAYLYENFSNGDGENSEITGRLAYFFDKLLFDRISVYHNTKFFPKAADPTDIYLTTDSGVRTEVTDSLFTEAKVTLEHDTSPAEDAKETDLYYTLGIGLNF